MLSQRGPCVPRPSSVPRGPPADYARVSLMTSSAPLPRLALFSGLRGGHGLYDPQRHLPGVRVEMGPWLAVDPDEGLAHYAHGLARAIEPGGPSSPLFLGGVSFGAMLAIEAAAIVRPMAIF